MNSHDRDRIIAALDLWISVRLEQQQKSSIAGLAQSGTRSAVTGGRHLVGINKLILDEIDSLGFSGIKYHTDRAATLPGYIRASKSWDLLVTIDDEPVLAVEYKSMSGSEGKNLNNRADEVIGVAEDLRLAQTYGLINNELIRAYVFLLEVTPEVERPVGVSVSAGSPDNAFIGATYLDRMALMCQRLQETGLYDLAWAIGVKRNPTDFVEPLPSVGWDNFSTELAHLLRPVAN